ncbi:uncharacterized protein LOC114938031 [Nylanderia fulva]|uniref:uncharacterized protein LOC114938031 n=1 Tax=Nylanderia fulva TaxID=613905 RepID=UPI0010FAF04A|nr:uncharacterized protein LOC114938031 [Nylanderia fulva]
MNQKNHYVSTYQKDYGREEPVVCQTESSTKPIAIKLCPCTDSIRVPKELISTKVPKVPSGPLRVAAVQLEWPARVFMKKIEDERPDLDKKLLDELCSDEKTARTDAERFKTTYQAHYSDPAATRMKQRHDLRQDASIRVNDQQMRCRMPIKIMIETDCPQPCHPSPSRDEVKHKLQEYKLKNGFRRDKERYEIHQKLPSWKSEYQDSINKIGHAIMKIKLHHAKRKSFPLQYQHCTTSN